MSIPVAVELNVELTFKESITSPVDIAITVISYVPLGFRLQLKFLITPKNAS